MRPRDNNSPGRDNANEAPHLALTHGQTIWLLGELGLRGTVRASTFNAYIKSLRKLGIPFERRKRQSEGRQNVTYDFDDLMELTIALLLRVYGWLPDDVAAGLRAYRDNLQSIYRQAYFDSSHRVYPPARISTLASDQLAVEGLFLDLNIRYSAGHLIKFGPPRAISPYEALCLYARSEVPGRSYLPFNVSAVAELIVSRTQVLPKIRRGRSARRNISH